MRDDHAGRELRGKAVVDLLALEPREHPVRRGGRDQLPFREQGEERPDRVRGGNVVLAVVESYVEIRHARLRERRVDVRAAEDVPERERRAVVGDRDHRFERLVESETDAGVLERSVLGDVLRLDRHRVAVVELARVDTTLRFGEDAELVQRRGDDLLLGSVFEKGRREVRVGDPQTGTARERGHKPVELLDEVGRARAGRPKAERVDDERGHDDPKRDRPHHRVVTASEARCFSV